MLCRSLCYISRQYVNHWSRTTCVLQRLSSSADMSTSTKAKEMESFQKTFPKVVDILTKSEKFCELPEVKECLRQIIETNVEGGKKIRGLTTVFAYEYFEKPENVTEEALELARIAGWCIEMMQAYFLITDDIMDSSITRRGAPCWFRQPDVGLRAINDAIMVKCSYLEIMKLIFKNKPYYINVIELMNDTLFNTSMGQHLDAVTTTKDYTHFTIDRYNAIVKYKSSFYTYNLPLTLGYLLTHKNNGNDLKLIEDLSFDMGNFFQIQDDFIDLYGDPKVTGKHGTDIQEGKCSWMAVKALEKFNPEQRNYFSTYYGKKEQECVEKIKQLYDSIDLRKVYTEYETAQYKKIKAKIETLPPHLSPKLFNKLMDTLIRRKY